MLRLFEEFGDDFDAAGLEGCPGDVTQVLSEDELIDLLPGYDGWIIGDDPASERVLDAGGSRLRAAVKWGVGVDNVDFAAFERRGIPITNTPGVFGREVADVAAGYVLGLARSLYRIDREVRAGGWPKPAGVSLWNKRCGIVGFGDIGRETARRCLAFGMEVIAYDPAFVAVPDLEVRAAVWPEAIETLDFLIFTCPLNVHTAGMFNDKIVDRVKRGLFVVNVARGPIIREQALHRGLQSGAIAAAALDVFETEPLPTESPLRTYGDCIFGSHNGSNTVDAVRRVSRTAIKHMAEFLKN
ncbi:phosphoglycerate dehydrogenase [Parvularcula dongshanensis]|nr:phosphoglycerate dehydrogenase [Parvularcula dongshanensis]